MHVTGEQLDKYVHDELTGTELRRVHGHLDTCAECSKRAAFLKRFRDTMIASRFASGAVAAGHPEEKKIFDYVAGVLRADERKALDEHISQCSECKLLLPTENELREFEEYLAAHSTVKPRLVAAESWYAPILELLSMRWMQVALGVVAIAALSVVLLRGPSEKTQLHERTDGDAEHVRLLLPAEGEVSLPTEFRWQQFDDATSYRLIFTESENPSVSFDVKAETTQVSSEHIPQLLRGKSYDWRVEASIGTRVLGESVSRRIVIK
jgi:predicted anti-sigma-YlaC factor YlaD